MPRATSSGSSASPTSFAESSAMPMIRPFSPLSALRRREGLSDMRGTRVLASPLLWVAVLFAGLVSRTDELKPVLHWAFPGVEPVIYQRSSFLALALSHFGLVAGASSAAILVGVSLAVFVTRPVGR